MTTPLYSIIIPVYNTEKSLFDLSDRLKATFDQLGASFEILFVDDCSPNPKTWPALKELAQRPYVRAFRFTRNFGQQPATICGLEKARGAYMLTLDDDGQHAPEDIPKLLEKKEHDIVIAELLDKKHSISKRIFSMIKSKFDEIILGKPKNLQLSAFRVMNRVTVNGMLQLTNTPYPFIPAMMFYVTKDITGVVIPHHERSEGETGYTFRKMMRLFQNLLVNNSSLLLRFMGNMGITISILSFLLGLFFLYKKLFFKIESVGWASIIVSVLFIGGMVLFCLGVLGEYLIRIINTVERRPIYLVKESLEEHAAE